MVKAADSLTVITTAFYHTESRLEGRLNFLSYRKQAGGRLTLLGRYMEDVKDTYLGSKIQNMLLEIDIRLIAQKKRQIRNEIEKKRPKNKTELSYL